MLIVSMMPVQVLARTGLGRGWREQGGNHPTGDNTQAPENTMPAFKSPQWKNGADWIELDVTQTKDGVLVIFHDSDLMRMTGKPDKIWEYVRNPTPPPRGKKRNKGTQKTPNPKDKNPRSPPAPDPECFGSLIPSPPFLLIYGKYGLKWKIYTKGPTVCHSSIIFLGLSVIRLSAPAFLHLSTE